MTESYKFLTKKDADPQISLPLNSPKIGNFLVPNSVFLKENFQTKENVWTI